MKKTFNAGLIVLVLVACGAAVWMMSSYFAEREPVDYEVALDTPQAGTTVSSPLVIAGRAHDNWFYNDEFPIEVRDSNDNVIGQAMAARQPDSEATKTDFMHLRPRSSLLAQVQVLWAMWY